MFGSERTGCWKKTSFSVQQSSGLGAEGKENHKQISGRLKRRKIDGKTVFSLFNSVEFEGEIFAAMI